MRRDYERSFRVYGGLICNAVSSELWTFFIGKSTLDTTIIHAPCRRAEFNELCMARYLGMVSKKWRGGQAPKVVISRSRPPGNPEIVKITGNDFQAHPHGHSPSLTNNRES